MKDQFNKDNKASMDKSTEAKKDGWRDKAGDLIEKAGHKISDAGAPKIGQKIHDLGDKVEGTHDNPSHPHKA